MSELQDAVNRVRRLESGEPILVVYPECLKTPKCYVGVWGMSQARDCAISERSADYETIAHAYLDSGWHPMSEKPPKGDGVYQATLLHKNTGKRGVDRAFYLNGKWPEFMFSTQVAWMELPEPAEFVIEEQGGE